MFENLRRRAGAHPQSMLALATFALLAPFLAKPFNVDDPLFIWSAKQILAHPLDPYGVLVNWYGSTDPLWRITENPPVACYFIAGAAALLGWSETGLHLAFLLPAFAVVLGTFRLAKRFCRQPMLAALLVLFTPVFLVSAGTVMCDVLMLAFWVWAAIFWMEGLDENSRWKLAAAGGLILLAEMTKYYGGCLVPLLGATALAQRRPLKSWAQFLLIPLAGLCAYQYVTAAAYNYSLLYRAMDYAAYCREHFGVPKTQSGLCALAFTGGGIASVIFFAAHLWNKRGLLILMTTLATGLLTVFCYTTLWKHYGAIPADKLVWVKIQMALGVTAGLGVLALALTGAGRRFLNDDSILLLLWVGGTFFFAAFCNWTVNARSILPMIPAVAILIARQLEKNRGLVSAHRWLPLILGAAFSFWAAWSDFSAAVSVRQSVNQVVEKYGNAGGALWFQGHWGFQFYMVDAGAKAMDFKHPGWQAGDCIVQPANNTSTELPDARAVLVDVLSVPVPGWLSTWNPSRGASFYASSGGPLPLAFGRIPPEVVRVYFVKAAP